MDVATHTHTLHIYDVWTLVPHSNMSLVCPYIIRVYGLVNVGIVAWCCCYVEML
jgi:hypothetical protein